MVLAGRLHPLLVHFPIALSLCAACAELVAVVTGRPLWQALAFIQTRLGAVCAAGTAAAGWLLARAPGTDMSTLLEWHRWLALSATGTVLLAAAATFGAMQSTKQLWVYRMLLFVSAAGIGLAAHFGAALVWGANFFHV